MQGLCTRTLGRNARPEQHWHTNPRKRKERATPGDGGQRKPSARQIGAKA